MAYFFDALFPGGIQDSGSKVCSSSFLTGSFFSGAHCPGWNIVPVLVGSALFSKLSNNVVDACPAWLTSWDVCCSIWSSLSFSSTFFALSLTICILFCCANNSSCVGGSSLFPRIHDSHSIGIIPGVYCMCSTVLIISLLGFFPSRIVS